MFTAAGLKKPDISILSEEFLAEVKGLSQQNLAADLLQRLLKDEINVRFARNVVQGILPSNPCVATVLSIANAGIVCWARTGAAKARSQQIAARLEKKLDEIRGRGRL